MWQRTFVGLMRSHELSNDKSRNPMLRSHYYKLSRKEAFEHVVSVLKKMQNYKVIDTVQEYGEILLEKKTITGRMMDITVTVVDVGPLKSAVDIYSASRGVLGDLGSNYRVILEIYQTLDQKLALYKTTNQ